MRHPEEDDMEDCPRCDGWGYLDKKNKEKPMTAEEQWMFPEYKKACPACRGTGMVKRVGKKLSIGGR